MNDADKAPARFAILTMLRLVAVAMIGGGMLVAFGENDWLSADMRVPVGLVLIGIGIVDLVWMVPKLARRWRTPQ